MQTLVIPIIPELPQLLNASAGRHRLGDHRHAARRPPSRRRSSAGSATCTASAGCCWSASCLLVVRLGRRRAVRQSLRADDRRPGAAGPRGRRDPARHQHHARRTARRAARLGDRADERLARRRRRARPARRGAARRERRLARAVLDRRRARRRRLRAGRAVRAGVDGAYRRPVRPGRRGRPVGRSGLACCWRSPRAPTGAGPSGTTLGLFGVAAVVSCWRGAGGSCAAREPLVDLRTTARPQVLLTNLASMVVRRSPCSRCRWCCRSCCSCPRQTGYGLGQSMLAVGLVLAPSGLVMMVTSRRSPRRISRPRGPKVTLMLGARRGRRRLRPGPCS